MDTEMPAERLYRRLGASTAGPEAKELPNPADDDPRSLLPHWVPEAVGPDEGGLQSWLRTVRGDPGRAGAIALIAVAALAVLVTIFTLVRDSPPPVVSAKLPPVQAAASSTGSAPRPTGVASASSAPESSVVVSVVGLVQQPGLVTVTPGARVADAITAAGGPVGDADTLGVNMARRVADGEQVVVGIAPAPGAPPALGSSVSGTQTGAAGPTTKADDAPSPGAGTGDPVNLNSATESELDTLPGVGPVTAAAIVAYRDAHGPFASIDQLGDVDGIGPARLQKLRELVRV